MSESPYRSASNGPVASVVVTTGADVPGHRVTDILGVVRGVAIRRAAESPGPKLEHRKSERLAAEARMVAEAEGLGAHAILAMRYDSGGDEVVAYGTAVRIDPIR